MEKLKVRLEACMRNGDYATLAAAMGRVDFDAEKLGAGDKVLWNRLLEKEKGDHAKLMEKLKKRWENRGCGPRGLLVMREEESRVLAKMLEGGRTWS